MHVSQEGCVPSLHKRDQRVALKPDDMINKLADVLAAVVNLLVLCFCSHCPAGTCDGCTFYFLWESSGACPTCTERDYHRIEGACKGGQQVCDDAEIFHDAATR